MREEELYSVNREREIYERKESTVYCDQGALLYETSLREKRAKCAHI